MSPTITTAEPKKVTVTRPSDQFRNEHLVIKKHLSHVEEWTGQLADVSPVEQQKRMSNIVKFFKEHIRPHAEWEEKKMYPAVDRQVDKQADRDGEMFTASMRHEHQIISRWIDELDQEASVNKPNVKLFEHTSYQLIGLIKAHFEEEEEVLLPILDKSMTAAEFREEIMSGFGQH